MYHIFFVLTSVAKISLDEVITVLVLQGFHLGLWHAEDDDFAVVWPVDFGLDGVGTVLHVYGLDVSQLLFRSGRDVQQLFKAWDDLVIRGLGGDLELNTLCQ